MRRRNSDCPAQALSRYAARSCGVAQPRTASKIAASELLAGCMDVFIVFDCTCGREAKKVSAEFLKCPVFSDGMKLVPTASAYLLEHREPLGFPAIAKMQ